MYIGSKRITGKIYEESHIIKWHTPSLVFIIYLRVTPTAAGTSSQNCRQDVSKPTHNFSITKKPKSLQQDDLLSRTLIARWVLIQIQLVVLFSIPPLTSLNDLRRNWFLVPFLADLICDIAGDLVLLFAVRENGAAVLGANIRSLSVLGRGVVHAVEKFEELTVGDESRVEGYLQSFGICITQSAPKTNFLFSHLSIYHRKWWFVHSQGGG